MSTPPSPSRNPLASRAAAILREGADDPWSVPDETEIAKAYAVIGLTDELRRANQIAVAQATGNVEMLRALGHTLGVDTGAPAGKAT